MVNTHVNLPGLDLKNPVMPASGTFGFGDVPAAQKFDLNDLGAMVIKTTTPHATTGNPQPQIAILEDGVLNSVGLTNPGVDQVISEKLTKLRHQYPNLPIMASVGGDSEEDYVEVAKKLSASGLVNALEINVSCPNVAQGGMSFGVHAGVVEKLTKKIKMAVALPIYVKLTPNVTDIVEIAKAAESGGADGISMINTLLGMRIDIKTRKPLLGHNMGGLSGEAVKPIAIRMISQVRQAITLPIIGMGGINSAQDVIEFMLAGANAVAVGTAHFNDELASKHIAEELPAELEKLGIEDINDLVGQVKFN
ncbi:dihydroorotate dehydrogenase [Lactobacillus helveticus]|uniref:Dihydroorotate dehydrogenase n=1 Tax=Lactobacillus helveticus TaxID=1587 RepID=A0A3S8S935_LACHE|nr:dihydroorotate dehydrogenase [Lactobacillus helveticus]AFR21751.1 dihydroorotate dehydrogenase 1B [Lactobacillus helveticus R0052]AZK90353.1 Dihydroorotate dehydrogenase B (NAD(+)), catalytic subunit [Lactobacillus helveticus]MCJ2190173.1 dihydroorotate dehydrogenase [Lactobacillus helveticus]MED7628195.1 dihydroorotate dehydrogenase [Lactobacillus helveticus]MZR05761.1 dihydroorotate dehydrogenase [Lactobacillus helveticus]